jgi:hypothetical protein
MLKGEENAIVFTEFGSGIGGIGARRNADGNSPTIRGKPEQRSRPMWNSSCANPAARRCVEVFSKLKTLLRGLAPCTKDALWTNVASLLDSFQECKNYFTSCGYVMRANQQINAHAQPLISQSAGKIDMSHIRMSFKPVLQEHLQI